MLGGVEIAATTRQHAPDLLGCNDLAVLYDHGQGTARDPARAAALFQRACDSDIGLACLNLARVLSAGQDLPRDPPRERRLLERACKLKQPEACKWLSAGTPNAGAAR